MLDDKLREILLSLLAVNANGEGNGVSVRLVEEGPHEIEPAIAQIKNLITQSNLQLIEELMEKACYHDKEVLEQKRKELKGE